MRRVVPALFITWAVSPLFAQPPISNAATQAAGSFSGIVTDSRTGSPVPGVTISLSGGAFSAITDEYGRYSLDGVPPCRCRVSAETATLDGHAERTISLSPAVRLTGIDFRLERRGTIGGKVVDDNGDPVADARVFLVDRERVAGAAHYFLKQGGSTNYTGNYSFHAVDAGHDYYVVAKPAQDFLDATSEAPEDLARRGPILVPTYYGNVGAVENAQPVNLQPGETREAVDIRLRRSPSYCLTAAFTLSGQPAQVAIRVSEAEPSLRPDPLILQPPMGVSRADGKARICGLHSGDYSLEAFVPPDARGLPKFYSETPLSVDAHDPRPVKVEVEPVAPIRGEAVWEPAGTAPDQHRSAWRLGLAIKPLTRVPFPGEHGAVGGCFVPCQFASREMPTGDYSVEPVLFGADAPGQSGSQEIRPYVKDLLYGGASILGKPLHLIVGGELRVLVADDGGVLQGLIVGKDGQPDPGASVTVVPQDTSEEELAEAIISAQADQSGSYTTGTLRPGKYRVVATDSSGTESALRLSRLWKALSNVMEIEIHSGETQQLNLESISEEQ
jgi:hypothetical protein